MKKEAFVIPRGLRERQRPSCDLHRMRPLQKNENLPWPELASTRFSSQNEEVGLLFFLLIGADAYPIYFFGEAHEKLRVLKSRSQAKRAKISRISNKFKGKEVLFLSFREEHGLVSPPSCICAWIEVFVQSW